MDSPQTFVFFIDVQLEVQLYAIFKKLLDERQARNF